MRIRGHVRIATRPFVKLLVAVLFAIPVLVALISAR
jgi:hypothetical protein